MTIYLIFFHNFDNIVIVKLKRSWFMNRTKIICSIGPACADEETITKLALNGMNVARFNMSHGTHESHKQMIDVVKKVREKLNLPIGIMIDTKGPEIRVKDFENGKIFLNQGDKFTLTTKEIVGNEKMVSVTYKGLPKIIKKGCKILLNDGIIELEVLKVTKEDVECEVKTSGELSNHKSINLPGIKTDMPYLSEQDKCDLLFAKEMEADFLAISFISYKEDVLAVKNYLKEIKFTNVKIISKIESADGVKNFDKILALSDGIMVARGDLGVEIDFVKLPTLQKKFIKKCNEEGKICITATQMLESMISNKRPTRAEISDVANAVYDKSTAIMLSGETASGKYPVESVMTMRKIADEIEKDISFEPVEFKTHNTSSSIGYAVCSLADTENVKAINVVTKSGETAMYVSRFHPEIPIIACTPNKRAYYSMSLLYGVVPVLEKEYKNMDDVLKNGIERTKQTNLVKVGDKIVQTGGMTAGKSGSNLLMVKKIK